MKHKQEEVVPKRERLTLTQLAGYDDILTDALVDHVCTMIFPRLEESPLTCALKVYFWTTIRKNRSKYNLTRGINQDDITHILLHEVIVAKDPIKAESSLLNLPGLRKFHDSLKTDREKEDFRRHLRKYINIWMPDCPFEVSTTNRYTIVTNEAATTARQFIKRGDMIKYLCGSLVAITPEEEKDLDLTRRDFSIVMSSRRKTPSIFLGPARFANHDCNANARLVTRGSDGMEVVAVRDIEVGDEITVTYGDNYFGEGNCECLCLTCEKGGRNGWPAREQNPSATGTATPADSGLAPPANYGLRSSKRRASNSDLSSISATPETGDGPPRKKQRVSAQGSQPSTDHEVDHAVGSKQRRKKPSRLRNELVPVNPVHSLPQVAQHSSSPSPSPGSANIEEEDSLVASVKAAFAKAKNFKKRSVTQEAADLIDAAESAGRQEVDTPIASPVEAPASTGETLLVIDVPEVPSTPSNPRLTAPVLDSREHHSSVSTSSGSSLRDDSVPLSSTPATSLDSSDNVFEPNSKPVKVESSVSDASESQYPATLDDSNTTVALGELSSDNIFQKPALPSQAVLPTIELPPSTKPPSRTRTPGDYIRTPMLLGEKYSRWVDCRTCAGTWVQPNGYQTRKECPRCERHSMLYGYQWPKSEKAGKEDDERVMDHRTVHRFIRPEEEKVLRKRGKGLLGPVDLDDIIMKEVDEVQTFEVKAKKGGDKKEDKKEEGKKESKKEDKKGVQKKKLPAKKGWKGWVLEPIPKRKRGRPKKEPVFESL
ncbi:MAG: hypothetical protein Q9191_007304 [Dirinaria sp. TL-2023a]